MSGPEILSNMIENVVPAFALLGFGLIVWFGLKFIFEGGGDHKHP